MSQNHQITPLSTCKELISQLEGAFTSLTSEAESTLQFKQEALFAYQVLQSNDYTVKVAAQNPVSLKNAILNVASIGLTLNPVEKKAYLVPRRINKQPAVCLDISYIGLVDIAIASGMIRHVVAKHVFEKDTFEYNGTNEEPTHKFNPFGDRGKKVGVYCTAKTVDGSYLTDMMSIDECNEIRNRSEAYKKGYGPWVSDPGEMEKKTVLKRAAKIWPKNNASRKLDLAIGALNEHEGIDFEQEKEDIKKAREERNKQEKQAVSDKQAMLEEISFLFEQYCKEKDLDKLKSGSFMHEKMGVTKLDDLKRKGNKALEGILSNLRDLV
jgi:recombination protein RecT